MMSEKKIKASEFELMISELIELTEKGVNIVDGVTEWTGCLVGRGVKNLSES